MIDNIKSLYGQVQKKTTFIIMAAEVLGKSPLTLRQHWFGALWAIPEEHQPRVVELLQNTILSQNTKVSA